jgi:hypothetical protein
VLTRLHAACVRAVRARQSALDVFDEEFDMGKKGKKGGGKKC